MKYYVILAAFLFPVCLFSQSRLHYGAYLKGNISTQTYTNPSKPQDGTTQWESLPTFGVGAFLQKDLIHRLGISSRLLWQRKGFTEHADFGIVGSPIFFENATFQNKFDYLSLDLLLNYTFLKRTKINISAYGGGELSWLARYTLESDIEPNNRFYPLNAYRSGYNNLNASWIAGLGCLFNQIVRLDFEVNQDFTPTLKNETLNVKNWLWSIGLGISIPDLFR